MLRARAIENQCYVIAVNRVGQDGNEVEYAGGSAVYGPEGEALAKAAGDEAVVTMALDLDGLRDYRQRFPAWRDADNFKVDISSDAR